MKPVVLPLLNLAGLALILGIAALTPGGALLGVFAAVPVLLASMADDRRVLLATAVFAGVGAAASTLLGRSAAPPPDLEWAPVLCVAAAAGIGALLQERRLRTVADRRAAETAGDMNRLLLSLLAHDLRSPLVLADQGFQYVEESCASGYPVDPSMLADVRARLQRSLRAIEMVLSVAADTREVEPDAHATVSLPDEIGGEIDAFAYEASARGKHLVKQLDALPDVPVGIDARVLRQSIAIALDNAVRYAEPGPVRVRAALTRAGGHDILDLRILDAGPAARPASPTGVARCEPPGTGLGLRLCGALVRRAGGSFHVAHGDGEGTTVTIRLPIGAMVDTPAPEPDLVTATG